MKANIPKINDVDTVDDITPATLFAISKQGAEPIVTKDSLGFITDITAGKQEQSLANV